MQQDLSAPEKVPAFFISLFSNFLELHEEIRNWYVLPLLYLHLGAHELCLRSGPRARISSWNEFLSYWNSPESIKDRLRGKIHFSVSKNHVEVEYRHKRLRFFFDGEETLKRVLHEIRGHFVKNEYGRLSVKGRDVVDVGAGFGETALYFAANGAKRVYALEPMPFTYENAKKNMRENKTGAKVTLLNQGCGAKSGAMRIAYSRKDTPGSRMRESRRGRMVRVVTLAEIVKKYGLSDAALKLDCEGCEYGVILNSDTETLSRFGQIIIEYHYGCRRIARKLREAGFAVECSPPHYFFYRPERRKMYIGMLYAHR